MFMYLLVVIYFRISQFTIVNSKFFFNCILFSDISREIVATEPQRLGTDWPALQCHPNSSILICYDVTDCKTKPKCWSQLLQNHDSFNSKLLWRYWFQKLNLIAKPNTFDSKLCWHQTLQMIRTWADNLRFLF